MPDYATKQQMQELELVADNERARLEGREITKVIDKPPKLISFVTRPS